MGSDGGSPTPPNTPNRPSAAARPFMPAARAAVGRGVGRGRRSGGTGVVSGRNSDFLASLSGLNISEGDGNGGGMFPWGVGQRSAAPPAPAPETGEEEPDIEWITDLME